MEFTFKRTLIVMGQLAQDAARTPPSQDNPPLIYVDRSLTILDRTFNTNNQKIRTEFLSQRDFISSQFREVEQKIDKQFEEMEKKVDGQFEEMEKKVDERFEEMEKKMDERFKEVDERFQKINHRFDMQQSELQDVKSKLQNVKVQLKNTAAITRNGRLQQMHQLINPIKVLKAGDDHYKLVWASHPQVPKHMKNTYYLGRRAKCVYEPSWDRKSHQQSMYFFIYMKNASLLSN